jgi:hypothetical protein
MLFPWNSGSEGDTPLSAPRYVLWIKYHCNGKPIRESAHTTKVKEAEKLLRSRLAAISTGTYVGPKLEKVPVSELADDLVREYRINGRNQSKI